MSSAGGDGFWVGGELALGKGCDHFVGGKCCPIIHKERVQKESGVPKQKQASASNNRQNNREWTLSIWDN